MNRSGLLLAALLLAAPLMAQTPSYQWHTFYNYSAGGWQGGVGKAVAADSAGNVYVVGETQNTGTFAPGAPLHAVAADARAAFIMKLSPAGELLWYTFYTGGQGAAALGVAVDAQANVYVTGNGNLVVDGGQPPLNNGGAQSMFVLKLNSAGQFQWHTMYGDGDAGLAIAVDVPRGYVYVTGNKHCCTGWSTPAPALRAHTYGIEDIFTLALDTAGAYQWHTFQGGGGSAGRAIAVDPAGDIVVAGMQSVGNTILKLNGPGGSGAWGDLAWLRTFGAGTGYGLAIDAAGGVYESGEAWPFSGTGGEPPLYGYVNPHGKCGFILKLDPAGDYLWHTQYGTQIAGLALDGLGYLYAGGNEPYATGFVADGGATSLHPNGHGGHFALALTTGGAYQWHTIYGSWEWDSLHGIALDPNRNLFLAGGAGAPFLGDDNAPPLAFQSGGDSVYVQKFAIKTTPVLTWANPADIQFGSALGPAQLNATADTSGTFVYTPAAGAVLPAGVHTLSVLFTPADTATYATTAKTVQVNVLPAPNPPATPARIVVTKTLSRSEGQILVNLTVSNTGGAPAANVQVTQGKIGAVDGAPLPLTLGIVDAGASASATLAFPAAAGNAGAAAVFTVAGSYTGGSFRSSSRITLP